MIYLKRQDGFIEKIEQKEFEDEKNKKYWRCYSHDKEFHFLDKDSKNIIPILKDILNRKMNFIEIFYLRILFFMTVFIMFMLIFIGFISYKTYTINTATGAGIKSAIEGIDTNMKGLINTKKPL